MITTLPYEVLRDMLLPMLNPRTLSSLVMSCNWTMQTFTGSEHADWWWKRLRSEGLYTSERPPPEYSDSPWIVFFRLADKKKHPCFSCQQPTNNKHPIYKQLYVCKACRQKPPYRMITRTTAMNEFGLKRREVESLPFQEVPNPRFRSAYPMRLYLAWDCLCIQGDRDADEVRNKRKEQTQKRRETITKSKQERRQQLTEALQAVGCECQEEGDHEENDICRLYIAGKEKDLQSVVDDIAFLRYLYSYTDFSEQVEEYVETLYNHEGYYYKGIWREASEWIRPGYVRPRQWPWLKDASATTAHDDDPTRSTTIRVKYLSRSKKLS